MTNEAPQHLPAAPPLRHNHKKRFWVILLTVIFLVIAILFLLYWVFIGRFWISTEDAYVHGNEVMVTPQVSGGIKAIYADDTDLVEEGQLIIELDNTDYLLRVEELKNRLADRVREISALFQDAEAKKAMVEQRRAQLAQAKADFRHRENLVGSRAVSEEEYQTYGTGAEVAQAQLDVAIKTYETILAQISNTTVQTHPRVKEIAISLKEAYLSLIRCQLWAPVRGFIAKRSAQVGDQVFAGTTLLYIVPLNEIWIEANYKESQLRHVRIGQPVRVWADFYGRSVAFHGKVLGFQPGSGNAFALLPPQNASGNWIKIIQRVPVRILLEADELVQNPLFLGLSMHTRVDLHDRSGKRLATCTCEAPIYLTTIFRKQAMQMQEYLPLIEEIIRVNTHEP